MLKYKKVLKTFLGTNIINEYTQGIGTIKLLFKSYVQYFKKVSTNIADVLYTWIPKIT